MIFFIKVFENVISYQDIIHRKIYICHLAVKNKINQQDIDTLVRYFKVTSNHKRIK